MEKEMEEQVSEEEVQRPGISDRLRGVAGRVSERATGTADTITGVRFRQQFEDFTEAVTTAVVGVHRDQAEMRERMDGLGTGGKPRSTPLPLIVFGAIAVLALVLSVVALARTF